MNSQTLRVIMALVLGILTLSTVMVATTVSGIGQPVAQVGSNGSWTVCPAGPPNCDFEVIQDAVDAAADGDVIKVAVGVYSDVNYRSDLAQIVHIDKTVTIRGGYTTDFVEPPDPEANPTTLDAQGQGRGLYIWTNISPTIEGLQIIGGNAAGLGGAVGSVIPSPDAGGAVYAVGASATFRDNRISGNRAERGGGLYLLYSTAILHGNQVSGNTAAGSGGGVYLAFSDTTMSGNAVISNTADWGGGLLVWDGTATLRGNTFLFNTATRNGGGLVLDRSGVTMINNVVADNQAAERGSGLYILSNQPRLLHTTIAGNTGGDGSGIYVTDFCPWDCSYSTVALTNTVLVGHSVGISASAGNTATLEATLWGTDTWANLADWGGAGAILTGTRNYWQYPAFADPDAGDYHILASSGAIDVGVDAGVSTDIDREARPIYGAYDLGADEFNPLLVTKEASPNLVPPGEPLTYTLTVVNAGNVPLTATITDVLSIHVTATQPLVWASQTITAPNGTWTEQVVVTVESGYVGPLVNAVWVTTQEGATGVYTKTSWSGYYLCLPLVRRRSP